MNHWFTSVDKIHLFLEQLKTELLTELPGVEAHLKLAPEIRYNELKTENIPDDAMESAVLILLYPIDKQLYTVVILRNKYDGAHSGQISLPGGKREESDKDFMQTALREAQEEIGINLENIEIIGQLSRFYVKPSNFIIYPFIAFQSERPVFHPDPKEVQRVIEINISEEISYPMIASKTLTFRNSIRINAPGFNIGNEFMWGATAMIFSELLQVLISTNENLSQLKID